MNKANFAKAVEAISQLDEKNLKSLLCLTISKNQLDKTMATGCGDVNDIVLMLVSFLISKPEMACSVIANLLTDSKLIRTTVTRLMTDYVKGGGEYD